jgi:hypothetical protein
MTDHVVRLYALAAALLALFLPWAAIAAHPWKHASPGPSSPALAQYEQRLRRDAALVAQLTARRAAASPPAVRVVTLPPLTATRSS